MHKRQTYAQSSKIYLFSDLDEQDEDDDDKHVVKQTDYPDDDRNDLEYKIREVTRLQRRRCGTDVIPDVTRQR